MPQIFQVLHCYSCECFQVHQVKKSNKWQCKVCNEKQSLKKAFRIGTARDCRMLVQQLNMQRAEKKCDNDTDEDSNISDSCYEPADSSINESCRFDTHWKESTVEAHPFSDCNQFLSNELLTNVKDFSSENAPLSNESENKIRPESTTLAYGNANDKISHVNLPLSKSIENVEHSKLKHDTITFSEDCNVELNKKYIDSNLKSSHMHKRSADNDTTASVSSSFIPPPFKKNKGFQMIVNAASKLK